MSTDEQIGMIKMLESIGFEHKIENGFHYVKGHCMNYAHTSLLNIGTRIKHDIEQGVIFENARRRGIIK